MEQAHDGLNIFDRNVSKRHFVGDDRLFKTRIFELPAAFGQKYNSLSLIGRMLVADNASLLDQSPKTAHNLRRRHPSVLGDFGQSEPILNPKNPQDIPLRGGHAVPLQTLAQHPLTEPVYFAHHVAETAVRRMFNHVLPRRAARGGPASYPF
jgi:hypothetical protein